MKSASGSAVGVVSEAQLLLLLCYARWQNTLKYTIRTQHDTFKIQRQKKNEKQDG